MRTIWKHLETLRNIGKDWKNVKNLNYFTMWEKCAEKEFTSPPVHQSTSSPVHQWPPCNWFGRWRRWRPEVLAKCIICTSLAAPFLRWDPIGSPEWFLESELLESELPASELQASELPESKQRDNGRPTNWKGCHKRFETLKFKVFQNKEREDRPPRDVCSSLSLRQIRKYRKNWLQFA